MSNSTHRGESTQTAVSHSIESPYTILADRNYVLYLIGRFIASMGQQMLFLCGAADNVSVLVRHTLVQLLTPDEKRGRVSAVNSLFIGTSNELGGFESGMVAHWFGPMFSVISGGIGTLMVVTAVALIWPEIRRYGRLGEGGR